MTSLSTLPRADLEELVEDGEVLEMRCEYCGEQYNVDPSRLRGLLEHS
jgi:molecular chaperone Hsp33